MALIPFFVPLIITIVGLLYVILAGKFVSGWKDEGMVIILIVGSWIAYSLGKFLEQTLGSDTMVLLFVVLAVLTVVLYIRAKRR